MIKLLSLFSGIGAFEAALRRGGYQFETVNYCEIDPYASKAYSQIHDIPEGKNLHDVREINPLLLDNINLVTYGFPCQDISVAGKQKGFEYNGERTRSGLFFEALRIIEFLQPEYAIAENVKALTGKKFTAEFETVLTSLDKAGYNNYWSVLNAKDYGIPQNRERVFIISIRKDVDTGVFTFPEKQELKLRVKDMLEPVVDEKYYIDNERSRNLIRQITSVLEPVICASRGRNPDNPSNREKGCNTEQTLELKKDGCSNTLTTVQKDNLVVEPQILKYERTEYAKSIRKEYENGELSERRCNMRSYTTRKDGISNTLTTVQKDNMVLEPRIKNIGSINGHQSGNVLHYDSDLSPCLCVAGHVEPLKIMQPVIVGGELEPKIKIVGHMDGYERTGRVYNPSGIACTLCSRDYKDPMRILEYKINEPKIKRLGNLYDENAGGARAGNVYAPDGLAPALQTAQGGNRQPLMYEDYRIRKLTPRECFRLMGFTDADFDKIKGISNTQLYKMAGNSIVVNVLEAIFKQLFKENHKL